MRVRVNIKNNKIKYQYIPELWYAMWYSSPRLTDIDISYDGRSANSKRSSKRIAEILGISPSTAYKYRYGYPTRLY